MIYGCIQSGASVLQGAITSKVLEDGGFNQAIAATNSENKTGSRS